MQFDNLKIVYLSFLIGSVIITCISAISGSMNLLNKKGYYEVEKGFDTIKVKFHSDFSQLRLVKIVSFEENFAFCPVKGSTTIIVIPSATLNGLASDY